MIKLEKIIEKLALSSSNNNLKRKIKILNTIHLSFLFHKYNNKSSILELLIRTILLVNNMLYKNFLGLINLYFKKKMIYNYIYNIL